jgi:hypothetical protein
VDVESSEASDALLAEYVVVLRAGAAARFLPEEGCQAFLSDPELIPHGVRVRAFTRWVDEGGKDVPRELVVEVLGRASGLDEAIETFAAVARPVATLIGFVVNVLVGPLEVHLAYEVAARQGTREFLEVFIPDERGPVKGGRIVRRHLVDAVWSAMFSATRDSARISRSFRHYELALRNWYIGGEWLALNHLWIAAENLTKAVVRKTVAERGVTEEDLARSFGLVTDDPARPRWKDLLGAAVRRHIIFAGDNDTYQAAKSASDGLEHGMWELNRIAENALKCTDKTFGYLRRSITNLLGLPEPIMAELMSIEPRDVQSTRTMIRGRLVGDVHDPAPDGSLYPTLEWHSGIQSIDRDGTTFRMKRTDRFTPRFREGVAFQAERLEVRGRLERGQPVEEPIGQDIDIEHETIAPAQRVLAAVMPLVDSAAATGKDTPHTHTSTIAFNLFGQAVAFFQSITILVGARQPIEALPALRALVILAARFEQMDDPHGPGLGVAVRLLLDELESATTRSPGDTDNIPTYTVELTVRARQEDVTVPGAIAEPETTMVYASLGSEMLLAREVANAGYAAATWHVQRVDGEHQNFNVAVEPGPLTDLVSSAATVAMLELLTCAATVLRWTAQNLQIERLLTEARSINETAAQLMEAR